MSLSEGSWTRISVHDVVAEFLRSERDKFIEALPAAQMALIDLPDTNDALANHARLRLLAIIRRQLVAEIPPDTQWYRVDRLTDADLDALHVIARCGWDHPADANELRRVAARKPIQLTAPPAAWPPPILWGHSRQGPFTIIEGNNRLVAYAGSGGASNLALPVLVGLSTTPCFWHRPDSVGPLVNDFWS